LRGIHCGDVPNSYDAHPRWPPATALPHASSLLEIRRKWALWLTPTLETELEPFETAIRKIGADAYLLEHTPGEPGANKRNVFVICEATWLRKVGR
jgi:hypothetical protein